MALAAIAVAGVVFAGTQGATASAPVAGTLEYVNVTNAGQKLVLKRVGAELRIVDADSAAVLARGVAAETRRVVVRGAVDADDTLTVDMAEPIALPQGIDYDGGARGWDTLVITGGRTQNQIVTQLTPNDGVIQLDDLTLRYSNLEPITDTTVAATLTILGTAGNDTITIADGPAAGQTTVSSPTFESYTFANKTAVTVDGNGGTDTVAFNNPNSPAALVTMIVRNVATVSQSATLNYPRLGILASGAVTLLDASNHADFLEIDSNTGPIRYYNAFPITIGGVDGGLRGLRTVTSGLIQLRANGTITLADNEGVSTIDAFADASIEAIGASSDLTSSVNYDSVTARTGSIQISAGRDILLGTGGAAFDNDVRAAGNVTFDAGRDVRVEGFSDVAANDFGTGAGTGVAQATVGRNFELSNANGDDASFGTSAGTGTNVIVNAPTGSVIITTTFGSPLFSSSGHIRINTDRLQLSTSSRIEAQNGSVTIAALTQPVDVGSATDVAAALEIGNAELARINTPTVIIVSAPASGITVTQPITYARGLTLRSANAITATGAGSVSAQTFAVEDTGATGRTWTISETSVARSPAAAIPVSAITTLRAIGGSGSDSFNVTPSATTAISVDGNNPALPGTPGDSLALTLAGATSPMITSALAGGGYAGTYSFANRANVEYSDIETLGVTTDIGVTLTDGASTVVAGSPVSYTLTASNTGAIGVANVPVVDTLPATISAVSWTCAASAGSSCAASGTGNLNEPVAIAAGGTVTFTITGTLSAAATGTLSNTATVAAPPGITDSNGGNQSATDTDSIVLQADLSINKTDGVSSVTAGASSVTYTITAANAGPSNAAGVSVADTLPAGLLGASWTCAGAGGGTCTAAGSGNIADTVNLPAGGSVVYTLTANVAATASGTLTNTATVTAPGGVTDPALANNSATDSDSIALTGDLAITLSGPASTVGAGSSVVYTVAVGNSGPSTATSAQVSSALSPLFSAISWTCVASGGASCAASGTGNLATAVTLPAGGSVVFTITAQLALTASGPLVGSASVAGMGGFIDSAPANNVAFVGVDVSAIPVPATSWPTLLLLALGVFVLGQRVSRCAGVRR